MHLTANDGGSLVSHVSRNDNCCQNLISKARFSEVSPPSLKIRRITSADDACNHLYSLGAVRQDTVSHPIQQIAAVLQGPHVVCQLRHALHLNLAGAVPPVAVRSCI